MPRFRNLVALILVMSAAAAANETPATLDGVFDKPGIEAAFVIERLDGSMRHVYNPERSTIRFSPASTFKVPNTLTALAAGVVEGDGVEFRWDGVDRGVDRGVGVRRHPGHDGLRRDHG